MKSRVNTYLAGMVSGWAVVVLILAVAVATMASQPSEQAAVHGSLIGKPQVLADKFGVRVVWMPAGFYCGDVVAAGCFDPATPDVIYIADDLRSPYREQVILHEIGHVMAHRAGYAGTECQADMFAYSMGSALGGYCSDADIAAVRP